jgi:hypothetical protein
MRLNVTQPVLDYEGKPLMVNQTNADGSPVLGKTTGRSRFPRHFAATWSWR